MNRSCQGDFFSADGERYYRCLLDGAVLTMPVRTYTCPGCGRDIEGEDQGTLDVQTHRYVTFPNGWKTILPDVPASPQKATGSSHG